METKLDSLFFCKYEGAGNDFIMVNGIANSINQNIKGNPCWISKACHRKFGIGADGLIILVKSEQYDFEMIYYNADGKEGSMCGNGARCAVAFAKEIRLFSGNTVTFKTCDGIHTGEIITFKEIGNIVKSSITIHMNNVLEVLKLDDENYFVETGSPHHVRFVKDLMNYEVESVGADIRHSDSYKNINGTNVNFAQTHSDACIEARTFERGVEKETFACGTGAVACAVVYIWNKLPELNILIDRKFITKVQMPGGTLEVSFLFNKQRIFKNIKLSGSANKTFSGTYTIGY